MTFDQTRLNETLTKENFRNWLLAQDENRTINSSKGNDCPIANFLAESNITVEWVFPQDIRVSKDVCVSLPVWAQVFVCNWDNSIGERRVKTALSILGE